MPITDDRFDALDLRSLRLFNALLETRSVTKAGEALAMSQPAASRVLAQLRHVLQDPLLVRSRHGNTLTPRAEALQPKVQEALRALSVLLQPETFDPANVKRSVRIATTDHGAAVVLTALAQTINSSAPGITLDVAPWSANTFAELETGKLDLALDAESALLENFHIRVLYQERYACLVRTGHPVLRTLRKDGSLDPRTAAAYPQVLLLYPVGDQLQSDDVLASLGYPSQRIAMRTPYFASAPLLVAHTDNLILLPTRLGHMLIHEAPLTLVPLHAKTDFRYRLVWHERTQKDPCMEWLRRQIYNVAK